MRLFLTGGHFSKIVNALQIDPAKKGASTFGGTIPCDRSRLQDENKIEQFRFTCFSFCHSDKKSAGIGFAGEEAPSSHRFFSRCEWHQNQLAAGYSACGGLFVWAESAGRAALTEAPFSFGSFSFWRKKKMNNIHLNFSCSFSQQKEPKIKAVNRSSRYTSNKMPKRLKTRLLGFFFAKIVTAYLKG